MNSHYNSLLSTMLRMGTRFVDLSQCLMDYKDISSSKKTCISLMLKRPALQAKCSRPSLSRTTAYQLLLLHLLWKFPAEYVEC